MLLDPIEPQLYLVPRKVSDIIGSCTSTLRPKTAVYVGPIFRKAVAATNSVPTSTSNSSNPLTPNLQYVEPLSLESAALQR